MYLNTSVTWHLEDIDVLPIYGLSAGFEFVGDDEVGFRFLSIDFLVMRFLFVWVKD